MKDNKKIQENNPTKRHVMYITGTRADYGLMKTTLRTLINHPRLKLSVVVTGMHLLPEFGNTIEMVKKDGFPMYVANATYEEDNRESITDFSSQFIKELSTIVAKSKPDIILLLGDRAEMLCAAIVGVYHDIPIAHIHGGDVSSTTDDIVRHAITKLSSIHFPATKQSALRVHRLGEHNDRIFFSGAPGLDDMRLNLLSKRTTYEKHGLKYGKPYILVSQHPVSSEIQDATKQMKTTLDAVLRTGMQAVIIYPNADPGGREMIKIIKQYQNKPDFKIFRNVMHEEFLSLMKYCSLMIGNSSSGMIESSSFKIPVVNIGTRQKGREHGLNVVDATYSLRNIIQKIDFVLYDKKFRKRLKQVVSPYGNGDACFKIANKLATIDLNKIRHKRITF